MSFSTYSAIENENKNQYGLKIKQCRQFNFVKERQRERERL